MRIYFRHGLYRADKTAEGNPQLTNSGTPGLVARTTNSPIVWTIAHHEKNYSVYEFTPVVFATPSDLAVSPESWLYVDLNLATGQKTYGITRVSPVYGPIAPTSPADDQHWFDTINYVTKVFVSATNRWHERVRLIFGHWDGLAFSPIAFGSSVGLTVPTGTVSGTVIYDGAGKVLKDSRDRFLTTEDKMFSDAASTHNFALETNITRAIAAENLPAFHVVKWVDFDRVGLAAYDDISNAVIAIALNSATAGESVELCIQGKIINDAWDWPNVNTKLWVNAAGEFSAIDPFDLETHVARKVPVARVLDRNTIIFDQGLGGKGDKGESGDVAGIFDASNSIKGITKLSVAPTDPENPIAVGINDPSLTAPRVPLEHSHPATEVTVSPFATFTGTNAQQALLYLFNSKLSVSGGTVTGNVTSMVSASLDEHLATLADVRSEIENNGLMAIHFDLLESTEETIVAAFNTLSTSERSFVTNDIVFVLFDNKSYVWLGGPGELVIATSEDQFGLLGIIDAGTGGGAVSVTLPSDQIFVPAPDVEPAVYTVFGEQRNSFPSLSTTDRGNDYIKTYVAGVFDIDADLQNIQPEDVKIGVIYSGTVDHSETSLILNGEVIDKRILDWGVQSAQAYWETAYRDNLDLLTTDGCFVSYFGFSFDDQEVYLGSDYELSYYTFDNKNVKYAWLVEQFTGSVDVEYNNAIYIDPPIMYTAVEPDVSSWTDLAENISYPTEPAFTYYDRPTSISLQVNLGGSTESWQSAVPGGTPSYQGVYVLLGYPTSLVETLDVSGATYDIPSNELDTWTYIDSFHVNGTVLENYILPLQVEEQPASWFGVRRFPGIASNSMFPPGPGYSYVQAINHGLPVLFEMAYIPTIEEIPE